MRRFLPILLILLPLVAVRPAPAHAAAPACATISANLGANKPPIDGATLVASSSAARTTTTTVSYTVQRGDTLSSIARRYKVSVRSIMQVNNLPDQNRIYAGQVLLIPVSVPNTSGIQPLAAPLNAFWTDGVALQGEALPLWIATAPNTQVTGYMRDRLGQQVIVFRPYCGLMWGLVAFDALWDAPGPYTLTLQATAAGRTTTQSVVISLNAVAYWEGPTIQYPPDKQALLDPTVLDAENNALTTQITALVWNAPQWRDKFVRPTDTSVTGSFGARGVLNGRYTGYHEGLDLRGPVGTPVYAAAPGTAIVAQPLTVRGNTVYIDHGGGVTTGYFHLSTIAIQPGSSVEAGQWIGNVGGTGLTTGPHLHWEVRVNGRWVNPTTWMTRYFP